MTLQDSRVPLIVAVERFALYARYVLFALLAPIFVLRPDEGELSDVIGIGIYILLHNAFAHWVLYTQRYSLFVSRKNAALYILGASYIVFITGAYHSEAYLLYIAIIIGAGAHLRDLQKTMLVACVCCATLAVMTVIYWFWSGNEELVGVVAAKLTSIVAIGWLVGVIAEEFQKIESDAFAKTRALIASQDTLRTILDSAADPILVYDASEIIVDANARACEFLGLTRESILGSRIRAFLFDDGTLQTKFASVRSKGRYSGEQIIVDALGEERTADLLIRRFARDENTFYVALLHDVTEQKNIQEAARLANANLERLNQELRHVDALKSGLLSTMGQRLISPLSALLGYLQMLIEEELGELNPEQRKALQTCRRTALRVHRVIEEAFDLGGRGGPASPSNGAAQRASTEEPQVKE